MAVIKSGGDPEPTVLHPSFCRRGPGIGFGRCPAERGAWVPLWRGAARCKPSSFVLVTAQAQQQASGSGAGLRVQARLHGLGLGLIIFLRWGRGVREIDVSKRSVDPLECAKSVRFPGTVDSFHQILSESHDPSEMLEALRQWENVETLKDSNLI